MKKRESRLGGGFTLIELLVVISIIGILSVLVISNLNDARGRAHDTKKKSELTQLKTALRLYYNDNQSYPDDSTDIGAPGGSFENADGTTIYMPKLPEEFTYTQNDADSFDLSVALENASDPDLVTSQTTCLGAPDASLNFYICSD